MSERKNYRIQLVKCKKCGTIVSFGEGTYDSSFYLSFGEYDCCNCGNVGLYPYEQGDERIDVDDLSTIEDMSLTWDEAPPPENTETMYAWFRKSYKPDTYYCSRGVAPWDGICFECGEEIAKGSDFVRFTFEKESFHAHWLHAACADNAIKYATLKQKKYRVHRVKCKNCGDVVACGEGVGGLPSPNFFGGMCRCTCGKVSIYPYKREQYRIHLWKATPDVFEDLSVEWDGEDTFPAVYKDVAQWPGLCSHCRKDIPEGSEYIRYKTPQGEILWLHEACAEHVSELHGIEIPCFLLK